MGLVEVLERTLPVVETVAKNWPIAAEALKVTKQIAGISPKDWDKRKDKARENLTNYFTQHNARVSDTLDSLRLGTRERNLLDRLAPGFAEEAEREISALSREQSVNRRESSDCSSRSNAQKQGYTIYPINKG